MAFAPDAVTHQHYKKVRKNEHAGIVASKNVVNRTTTTQANTSSLQAAVFPAAVAIALRGGATSAASVDVNFSREGFNLQVLATYASLRLFKSTKFPNKTDKQSTKILAKQVLDLATQMIFTPEFTQ
mgnify:CR=1 FL=1